MKNCLILLLFLTGCIGARTNSEAAIDTRTNPEVAISSAISSYEEIKSTIDLGDDRDDVVWKLEQAMFLLRGNWKLQPEKYIQKGVRFEIYYARTGLVRDSRTTRDEFTPYLFNDDILIAIGWGAIKRTDYLTREPQKQQKQPPAKDFH